MDKLSTVVYFILFSFYVEAANEYTRAKNGLGSRVWKIVDCNSTRNNTWEFHPHPFDCNLYVTCMNNVGIVQKCPEEFYFNPEEIICDFPDNVDCETQTTITESTTTQVTEESTLTEETTGEETSTTELETESTTEETGTETTITVTDENTVTEDSTVDTTTDQTTTDQTTTDEITTDQTTTDQTSTDQTTTDQTTIDQTTTDEITTDQTTTDPTTTDTTANTQDNTGDPGTDETGSDDDTTTETSESDCQPYCADFPPWGGEGAHPTDCNRFISCSDQCMGATLFCPPNLHFNHNKLVCDFASRAECLLKVCNNQPDGPMASMNSCRHYFVCAANNAFLQSCGGGLVFDPSVSSCVPENESNGCEIDDIPPAPPSVVALCDEKISLQIFRHPNYCDVHYRCVRGMIFARRCQSGLDFDEVAQVCNLQEIVNCSA